MDFAESSSFPPAERKDVPEGEHLGRRSRKPTNRIFAPKFPVPVLYFAETEDAKYEIIDGQQRVRPIVRFVSNEFGLTSLNVLNDDCGMRFHEFPEREQRLLKMRMPCEGDHTFTLNVQARAMLQTLLQKARTTHVSPYFLARIYAALGDKDEAFRWLETAFDKRDHLTFLPLDFWTDAVRSDRRFLALFRRLHLPA
jgi:hypothetical protein